MKQTINRLKSLKKKTKSDIQEIRSENRIAIYEKKKLLAERENEKKTATAKAFILKVERRQ